MQTEKTGDFIFTESMPFDKDYIYFLEIYVLTQNNIDKNFLRVDQIDNFPDPFLLKKENSIHMCLEKSRALRVGGYYTTFGNLLAKIFWSTSMIA